MLIGHLYIFFGKLFILILQFFNCKFLIYSKYKSLTRCFTSIFSFLWVFHFLDTVLWGTKLFVLIMSYYFFPLGLLVLLMSCLRYHCLVQSHEDVYLCLIFALTFQVKFLYTIWGRDSTSFFYMWLSSYDITICWKDYSFLIEWCDTLVKNQLNVNIRGLSSGLSILFHLSRCLTLGQYHTVLITVAL